MPTGTELNHDQAMRIVEAVSRHLEERSAGAAVAVVDPHGELIAFIRTDGCPLPAIANAIHKAFTAAREGVESGLIGERARTEGFPITNFGDLRYTGWGGGVPVMQEGSVIGAVGVSGLAEHEDIELARLGASTIKEDD
ncbi:MAG: GlcG/HbpS family heme-binding protein [Acidimicrobiia bacterium]